MTKKQGRKPPKRKASKPRIDDDLAELALVLDQHRLDNNIGCWLELPWRDGWNAVGLALDAWSRMITPDDPTHALVTVQAWAATRRSGHDQYHLADEMILAASQSFTTSSTFARTALRCVQLLIARSSGGGHGYNEVLRHTFERAFNTDPPGWLEASVRFWRCADAIGFVEGTTRRFDPKLERAFRIAWDRGLYYSAYGLPKATKA